MKKKIWFLDNLRLILAFFVVIWHAANAYIGLRSWPIIETNSSIVVYGVKTILDAITMPLFFYISGYFALPSIKKRGSSLFIKTKVRSILFPWIIGILLITPFIEMIAKISKDTLNTGYFNVWKWQIHRILEFNFGIITDGFYQRYMWFLSVLFTFFGLLGVAYFMNNTWFNKNTDHLLSKKFTNRSILKLVAVIGFLTFIPMMCIILSIIVFTNSSDPEPFFSVFNLIQFQSSRLPIYIVYFLLGVLTYRNQWFERGLTHNRKLWNMLFAITGISYFMIMNVLVNYIPDEAFGLLFMVSINLFIISTLGFALANAMKFLDKPLLGNGEITAHAFTIYIIHYIYVHIMQLVLLNFTAMPVLLKFILVAVLGFLLSYITSRYLIKPDPKLTVVIGIMVTFIMFLVIY